MSDDLAPLWPHQHYALAEVAAARARGERRLLVVTPTGGGKSRVACELIEAELARGRKVALYTNRRLLVEQTSRVAGKFGLAHGVRAAGYEDEREFPFQICSLQTEQARRRSFGELWRLHDADTALVDEAHLQKGEVARRVLEEHHAQGATVIGLTATPLDLGSLYETLIQAGTTSELRRCGALVYCVHYGPDEPDLRHIGKFRLGEDLTEAQNKKAIMVPGVFGRVLDHYRRLNPEQRPTILFAPGVEESRGFAEAFSAAGIRAAHLDGQECWLDGQDQPTSQHLRAQILEGSRTGAIRVLCNRFVLREGIDCPWLAHGIFACVFGALQSYLQSGGRLLRAAPGVREVTLQDHGGNWHRHGSLNADRQWTLGLTAHTASALREERLRDKREPEPTVCPQCQAILLARKCRCGFTWAGGPKTRPVIQADGSLREYRGDVYRPRRLSQKPDAAQLWQRVYYRAKNAGLTFAQARALFARENDWGWPPPSLPLMPRSESDWFLKVADVPADRLTGAAILESPE